MIYSNFISCTSGIVSHIFAISNNREIIEILNNDKQININKFQKNVNSWFVGPSKESKIRCGVIDEGSIYLFYIGLDLNLYSTYWSPVNQSWETVIVLNKRKVFILINKKYKNIKQNGK